jgi:hypothetical protein
MALEEFDAFVGRAALRERLDRRCAPEQLRGGGSLDCVRSDVRP